MLNWVVLFVSIVGAGAQPGDPITVSAAVSLREVLTEIASDYEASTGQRVTFNFGSTGRLAQQIEQGAPVDLFISASESQMVRLIDAGAVDRASSVVVARNRLVVIVPADARFVPDRLASLADPRIRRIAIGQPATVPAGEYALGALERSGVAGAVRDRLIQGANVRQVMDYVMRGEVDGGLVYRTDAVAAGAGVKVAFVVDDALHAPIVYLAAIVTTSRRADAAGAFVAYLRSDPAVARMRHRGFITDAPATQPAGR